MSAARHMAALAGLVAVAAPAWGAATGLNTIPTTDLVPYHSMVLQLQNGNTGFHFPAFYNAPNLLYQSQFALTPKIEAGIDVIGLPDRDLSEVVLNFKELLQTEDDIRPNIALGVENV